jgi:hypothetical protein
MTQPDPLPTLAWLSDLPDCIRLVDAFLAGHSPRTLAAYRADLEDFRCYTGTATTTGPTAMCRRWRNSPATRTCAASAATAATDRISPAKSQPLSQQSELRTADHSLTGSLAGIAADLGGLRLAGYGINGGPRGMSDRETPEASMMRDYSSINAAPATLRAEESQPGGP